MKIAIIGCGQIADAHIQEVLKIGDAKVLAVCDLNRFMAKQAALRFTIPGCYTDVQAMLQEVKPDVVHITTPPASHLSLAKICLENGSHVYIEKPFALNLPEAEKIIELAEKTGRLVCAGHNTFFDPAYQRLLRMHTEKKLGEISHIDAAMGYNLKGPFGSIFMGDPQHWLHHIPGGVAQNNISHPISLILGLMPAGSNIQVKAFGYRFRDERYGDVRDALFDEVRAVLVAERITANLVFSCRSRPVQTFVHAYGTRCAAFVSLDARTLRFTPGAMMPGPFAKLQWAAQDAKEANREFLGNFKMLLGAHLHYFAGMGALFKQFYAAVRGQQEMPIPMAEALRVTAVMDAIIDECKANDRGEFLRGGL
jgi:predicted dehydrogenase